MNIFKTQLNIEDFQKNANNILNVNNPSTLGVKPLQSFVWAINVLNEIGVTFDDPLSSTWNMFSKLEDINISYIKEEIFKLGLESGFNNFLLSKEIDDFSLVFGYYPGSPYVLRAVDQMFSQISSLKRLNLSKYKVLDNKNNLNEGFEILGFDSTPISNLIFYEKLYLQIFDEVENKQLINKEIPYVPINHLGIFFNKHLFNMNNVVNVEASKNLRIVAHYPLKRLLFPGEKNVNSNVSVNSIKNLPGSDIYSINKVLKNINF